MTLPARASQACRIQPAAKAKLLAISGPAAMAHRPNRELATAPDSHQKRPHRDATNAIERKRNRSKINEADR